MKFFREIDPNKGIPAEFVGGISDGKRMTVQRTEVQFGNLVPMPGLFEFRECIYAYQVRIQDGRFVANDEGFFLFDHYRTSFGPQAPPSP